MAFHIIITELMQSILKCDEIRNISLTLDKVYWTFWYMDRLSRCQHIHELHTLQMVQFLAHFV